VVTDVRKRCLLCALVNAERIRVLRAAGVWPAAVESGDDWSLKPADSFDWLPGWPGGWPFPPPSFATEFGYVDDTRNEAFRAALRSIRATNRPDQWEDFLTMAEPPPLSVMNFRYYSHLV
jgi:hypothetical protein